MGYLSLFASLFGRVVQNRNVGYYSTRYCIQVYNICQEASREPALIVCGVLVGIRLEVGIKVCSSKLRTWGRQAMKINVEMEMTPEELRRFMGLPDVQGVQQQMLESFTEGITASADQRDEFLRNVFAGAKAPWQNFFNMVSGMNPPGGQRGD